MKKWYQSAFCKGMLILLSHVSAIAIVICLLIGLAYPGQNYGELFTGKKSEAYEETTGFANKMSEDISEIIDMLNTEGMLSSDGSFSQDTIVDIPTFSEKSKIAEQPGTLSFRIRDIIKDVNNERNIVVCKKPEGELKYQYYTPKELVEYIRKNNCHLPKSVVDEYGGEEAFLRLMEKSHYTLPEQIYDKDYNLLYNEIWAFNRTVDINTKTVEGKNMLELANTSAEWNGKLEQMSEMFEQERSRIIDLSENYQYAKTQYREGDTNLAYLYVDYDKNLIKTNRAEYQSIEGVKNSIQEMMKDGKYIKVAPTLEACETNLEANQLELSDVRYQAGLTIAQGKNYILIISVDTEYPIQDAYYMQNLAYEKYMPWMNRAVGIGVASVIVFLVCLVWLTAVAGHSNHEEGIVLVFFDKWKTEITLCLIGMMIIGGICLGMGWVEERIIIGWNPWYLEQKSTEITAGKMLEASAVTLGAWAVILSGYLSLVRIIKAKTFWKNSILKWFVHTVAFIFQNRNSVTKGIIVGGILFLINLFFATNNGVFIMLAIVADIFAIVVMVKRQIEKENIRKGIARIANGDAEYQIPLEKLSKDNAVIAENVNHIGEGIQNAVEKSLKDERLKTDLITNVSHDIKTPLTSIINYVGLLKQEHFEDPKIQKYLDVLDEKSQRLKTLTEDVVEASKISSGNINLDMIQLDLVEMIHQTTGEFAEKFENKGLNMVMNLPEEPVMVKADGRRMWRVVENIYNNAAKYAMPGTRIYADMKADGKEVQFSLKNISENPLNISADELTERFIRGDISRSTEGSELGLSIAKNLTTMQGGQFKVYVDGDLFKVTITFPQIK